MEECPVCEGVGEVLDRYSMHRSMMSPPYKICSFCNGSGQVSEEEYDCYYPHRTSQDYEEDDKADAWEQREDLRRDR